MRLYDIFNNLSIDSIFNTTDFIFIDIKNYDRTHLELLNDNWICMKNTDTYTYYIKDMYILKCTNASEDMCFYWLETLY